MILLSFLVLVFLPQFVSAQALPETTYQAILTAQDLRDGKALVPFLKDEDSHVRARAAFACGSVQDTALISLLVDLLIDQNHRVRTASAFALGQLNPVVDTVKRQFVSSVLAKRLGLETHREVLIRVFEALGKVGTEASLSLVVAAGETSPSSVTKGEAALAVGRYAYRRITSKTATDFAARCLSLQQGSDTWKAAFALMRVNDAPLLSRHEEEIIRAASSRHADVRMFIATALGHLVSSRRATNTVLSLARGDKVWRVLVNAVKSLARVDTAFYSHIIMTVLRLVTDSNEHVALTALSTLGELKLKTSSFGAECRKTLLEQMRDGSTSQRRKKEAAVAVARIFGSEAYLVLSDQYRQGNLSAESFATALAFTPTREALQQLVQLHRAGEPRLRFRTLDAMQTATKLGHDDSALAEIARPAFVDAMQSKDITVVSVAASALADSLFRGKDSPALLMAALQRLKSPDDADAMVAVMQSLGSLKAQNAVAPLESHLYDKDPAVASAARKALQTITGKTYSEFAQATTPPSYTNFDWTLLQSVRRNPHVRVRTTKGSFTFMMLPDEAPFTCINFAKLIDQKFFDGLTFHRVVPSFVIQGGDPRGDGWGGPGYAIRSEFGFEHYTRGTVGVASSGKDTEGCQWFVTHGLTPHLDGRYTIFGRVVSGMEVVDEIQVGDRIELMRR